MGTELRKGWWKHDSPTHRGEQTFNANVDQLGDLFDATNLGSGSVVVGYALDLETRDLTAGTASFADLTLTGDLTVASQAAIGGASIVDDALKIDWSPENDSGACGIELTFTPQATSNGSYPNRGLSFNVWPAVSASVTNSSYASSIRGAAMAGETLEGTLDDLLGHHLAFGLYTGCTGTVNHVYGFRLVPYRQAGTVGDFYAIQITAPYTGATVTGEAWMLYSANADPSYLAGSLGIGSPNKPTANGDKVLWFGDNGAQPTVGANTAAIYGYDSGSGTVEVWVTDEAGNDTQLSSHGPSLYKPRSDDTLPFVVRHANRSLGIMQEIDLSGAIRLLEEKFGVKLIHESTIRQAGPSG